MLACLFSSNRQCLVQVLDARDPLRYRSEDLESYSVHLHPTKGSVLLLNKADLLPAALRSAWADYFDQAGVEYVFWSAKAGIDSLTAPGECLPVSPWDEFWQWQVAVFWQKQRVFCHVFEHMGRHKQAKCLHRQHLLLLKEKHSPKPAGRLVSCRPG